MPKRRKHLVAHRKADGHKTDVPGILRTARESLKLTRRQVAADLEMNPSSIQRWELPKTDKNHRGIGADDYERLMDYYKSKPSRRTTGQAPETTAGAPSGLSESEARFLSDEAARLEARLSARLAEGAGSGETDRLRRLLEFALTIELELSIPDARRRSAMVGRIMSNLPSPHGDAAAPVENVTNRE